MLEKSKATEQTNLAFDFIQNLYLEVSYMIKQIEGILEEEEEKFVIGRPAGYHITTKSSTGLEAKYVKLWLVSKFGVFFVPEQNTKLKGGQTWTPFDEKLKVLYLRIILDDEHIKVPKVYSGVLFNIKKKPYIKWTKFEHFMSFLEYNDAKVFKKIGIINYEDQSVQLNGELFENDLYDINDSETILKKIVKPSLALYRKY